MLLFDVSPGMALVSAVMVIRAPVHSVLFFISVPLPSWQWSLSPIVSLDLILSLQDARESYVVIIHLQYPRKGFVFRPLLILNRQRTRGWVGKSPTQPPRTDSSIGACFSLAALGVVTSLVAQHMYSLPAYAFIAQDYTPRYTLIINILPVFSWQEPSLRTRSYILY